MRILIAVDGSTPSELARALAAGIPWPPASTLRVVAALEIGGALFGAPWYAVAPANADELEQRYLQELGEYAAATAARLQERERSVQSAVIRGRAAAAIVEEARRFGAAPGTGGARGPGPPASAWGAGVPHEVRAFGRRRDPGRPRGGRGGTSPHRHRHGRSHAARGVVRRGGRALRRRRSRDRRGRPGDRRRRRRDGHARAHRSRPPGARLGGAQRPPPRAVHQAGE